MLLSTSTLRGALFVFSYFLFSLLPAAAQSSGSQYAANVVDSQRATNPQLAADGDPQTAAVLRPATIDLLAYNASEQVQFPTAVAPNTGQSGFYMQVNKLLNPVLGSTLDASLFKNSTVNAYFNGVPVGSWSVSSLLQATLLQQGRRATVNVAPTSTFNQLELVLDGTLNGYTINFYEAFAPVPAPLPVQLAGFQAKASPTGVQLNWTTASELNCQYFEVERASGEAAGTFVALGRVAGAGSSSQAHSYHFVDAAPGPLGYYRLRQVDADGTVHFSPVVAVQGMVAAGLAAYPSPATSLLTVAGAAGTQLRIFNQQGQLVRQATLAAGPQALDISALPAGFYVLRDEASGQHLRIQKTE